jgi:phage major head subunit gpT-like protein
VSRWNLEDDNYGIYGQLFQQQGYRAAMWPDDILFPIIANGHTNTFGLAHDGQNFFSTAHTIQGVATPNYTDSGSGNRWILASTQMPMKPFIFQERMAANLVNQDNLTDDAVFERAEFRFSVEARGAAAYGFWKLAYMTRGPLDETNVVAAKAAIQSYRDEDGVPLNVMPNLIICGPSNEIAARKIANNTFTAGGDNVLKGMFDVVVSGHLA